MTNLKTTRTWDKIWEKVSALAGFERTESPWGAKPTIDEDITIYVETTGSDNGSGTINAPFATPQAAIDYLSRFIIDADVVIQIGPGTFPGFALTQANVTFGLNGTLDIRGSTSIVDSGTFTSGTVTAIKTVMTDSTKSWTVDAFKGKLLVVPSVTNSSDVYRPIVANTSNTLSIPKSGTAYTNGSAFNVVDLTTTIDATIPASGFLYAMAVENVLGGAGKSPSLTIDAGYKIKLTNLQANLPSSGLYRSLVVTNSDLAVIGCRFIVNATNHLSTLINNANVSFIGTYMESSANHGGGVVTNFGNNSYVRNVNLTGCYLRKPTSKTGIWVSPQGCLNISATAIEGSDQAVSIGGSGHVNSILSIWVIDCNTGLIMGSNGSCRSTTVYTEGTVTTAVQVTDGGFLNFATTTYTITATNAFVASTGGRIKVPSTISASATNELTVDGVVSTLAAMRAASPKTAPTTANIYGSLIYE